MKQSELNKEAEIFTEIVSDILNDFDIDEHYINEIVDWHERGRDEVIQVMKKEQDEHVTNFIEWLTRWDDKFDKKTLISRLETYKKTL